MRSSFRSPLLLGFLVAALSWGCSTTKPPADGATTRTEAVTKQDAPPTVAASGEKCGTKTCAAGEVCCNASCGICTKPGDMCTQQICEEPAAPACKVDADCRLFSDYCTGCDCRVLAKGDPDPTCKGPGVRCVADPCRDQVVACQNGRCMARATR